MRSLTAPRLALGSLALFFAGFVRATMVESEPFGDAVRFAAVFSVVVMSLVVLVALAARWVGRP